MQSQPNHNPGSISIGLALTGMLSVLVWAGCGAPRAASPASIEFTRLPPAGAGSDNEFHTIEGRVTGAQPGERIVLYARSGTWWVQPVVDRPFTTIQPDLGWKNSTHPGSAYAAVLVDAAYKPAPTSLALPQIDEHVRAVATTEGIPLVQTDNKTLQFSGYEWLVRESPGNPGGTPNRYDPANAWVDHRGFLHLRILQTATSWTSAEVDLPRSLGYGAYRFTISDVSQFDPSTVLSISTWDDYGPSREMNIEIGRWGETGGKNAQYVIQPYYIPANVVRFLAPAGPLIHTLDWQPGRVAFSSVRPSRGESDSAVFDHVFTSGVPSPGRETIRLNLYVFDNRRIRIQHGAEVIFEKFEYLP